MDFNQNGFPDFVFSGSQPRSNRTDFLAFENSDPDLQGTWVQRDDLIAPFQNERTAKDTVFFDPSFADLNNDGDPDLFVTEMILTGQDSGRARYKFYQNLISPDSIIWKERGDWLTGIGQQTFHQSNFGDLDFDGDDDLIIGTKSGTLIFYENIGNAALPKWQLNTGVFRGIDVGEFATPATGDFDGDGKIDLLVGSHEGDIFFYRNETIISVENIEEEIPQIFNLLQNYPNPFNPSTTIRFDLPVASKILLTIYNPLGQKVRELVDGRFDAGQHQITWDGRDDFSHQVASGVYFLKLSINKNQSPGEFIQEKKCSYYDSSLRLLFEDIFLD